MSGWAIAAAGAIEVLSLPRPSTKDRTLDDELKALLDRARDGDDAAFAAWVRAVTPTLFRLGQRLAGDPVRADDLVQDAVVRAWRALPTLRDTKASRAWACRILRNAAVDDVRRAARRRESSLEAFRDVGGGYPLARELVAGGRSADEVFAAAEARAFVRAVLETLPEHHRLALWLHDVDGLTQEEIADALEIPLGTVASRLSRARVKLEEKLKSLANGRRWRFL